jgi:ribosomal protein S18 acetylase RimI-like enzyme
LQYLAKWPEYFEVAETPSGRFMGYIMGKAEGENENWHGHVTALTVAPEYRRIGLGTFRVCSCFLRFFSIMLFFLLEDIYLQHSQLIIS